MTDTKTTTLPRRQFLKIVSSGALAVPVIGLNACGGGDEAPAAPAPSQPAATPPPASASPQPAAETPVAQPAPEPAPNSGGMPMLSESDPQANALGYVADASTVDANKYPQFAEGNICANCALYTAAEDSATGPCSIFPGKLVDANGWCSVYAPKM